MSACKKPVSFDGLLTCVNDVLHIDVAKFVEIFPEFGELTNATMERYGDTAIALLNSGEFGQFYQLAVGLLTAHRLALTFDLSAGYESAGKKDQTSTEVGTNVSASSSSLSTGSTPLSLVTGDDPFAADLARTKYGLELLALIRTLISPVTLTAGMPVGRYLYTMQWPPANTNY